MNTTRTWTQGKDYNGQMMPSTGRSVFDSLKTSRTSWSSRTTPQITWRMSPAEEQVVVILSTNKHLVFIRGIEGAVTVDLASTSLWYHALRLWQLMTSRGQTPCLPSSEPVIKNLHGLCLRVDAVISFKSWRSINVGSVCDLLQDLTNEATLLDYNYPII